MLFLIGNPDDNLRDLASAEHGIRLVEAPDAQAALEKYARQVGIREDYFLDHLHENAANMSYAERFWLATDEEKSALDEKQEIITTDLEFENRVRAFFPNSEWADLYIQSQLREDEDDRVVFPDDMLLWIWLRPDWGGNSCVLPLDRIPRL